jgi:hypothetical protein
MWRKEEAQQNQENYGVRVWRVSVTGPQATNPESLLLLKRKREKRQKREKRERLFTV